MRSGNLAFLIAFLATAAFAAVSPETFVERVQARFDQIRAVGAGGREPACRSLVADLFDVRAVFADAAKAFQPGPGVIRRVREIEGGIKLTVQFPKDGDTGTVFVWTLRPGGSLGFTARDLSVDGRGVVAMLRADLDAALAVHDGNVAAAIADLARSRRK